MSARRSHISDKTDSTAIISDSYTGVASATGKKPPNFGYKNIVDLGI